MQVDRTETGRRYEVVVRLKSERGRQKQPREPRKFTWAGPETGPQKHGRKQSVPAPDVFVLSFVFSSATPWLGVGLEEPTFARNSCILSSWKLYCLQAPIQSLKLLRSIWHMAPPSTIPVSPVLGLKVRQIDA